MRDQQTMEEPHLDDLRRQIRRLQWMVYGVWPAGGLILLVVAFVSTRQDKDATRVAIKWIESTALTLGATVTVLALIVFGIAFAAKLWTDYRNRNYRWSLNPGSRRPPTK